MSDSALLTLTAWATVCTGLATIGLVLVAWFTLRGAAEQLKLLREQAESESRPYVVLTLTPGLHGSTAMDLVIENLGRSMARGLVINAGQHEPQNEKDHITVALLKFLEAPKDVAPGERLRVMWRMIDKEAKIAAGIESDAEVVAVYRGDRGKEFIERRMLLASAASAMPVPVVGPERTTGNETTKVLANINHALRTLNTHVGELRR